MKEIQKKLDDLFLKAGQYNRYQFIMVTLFIFQFLCSQFFHENYHFLTSNPIIKFNNTEIKPNARWCKNHNNPKNMVLAEKQMPTTSIIIDFELACQTTKLYLINVVYYFGNILGSCIAYHFYEKVGTKISLCIFDTVQIASFLLLEFLNISTIKNNLVFLYVDLFLIGFSQYIIINLIFLYICDIIKLGQIPLFITIIVCGRALAGLLGIIFFEYLEFNWKHDICIIAGLNLIILVIILFYMVSSPKAALRNSKYVNFVKHLIKIAKKNKIILLKKDFDFLLPFMKRQEKIDYQYFFTLYSPTEKINNDNDNNTININSSGKSDKIKLYDQDEEINSEEEENEDIFLKEKVNEKERKEKIKDDYLLSEENNKIGSVKTLFNKINMNDYSFFDFFKFKTHLINFSILSFLWAVYNFIKYGMEATLNEISHYYTHSYWSIIIQVLGLINLFLILLLYLLNNNAFHKILTLIQLLTFIVLSIGAYLYDDKINIISYIVALLIAKIIWNCLYLLLLMMSLLIYPIMLRSKGLGWNIALGVVGKLLVTFAIDLTDKHAYILYFLLFDFLTLIFSNNLPSKFGSLTIDLSKDEKAKKILDKIFKEYEDGELNNINEDDGKISLMSILTS